MRQLLCAISGLAMIAGAMGCHHTAGACDCDGGPHDAIISPAAPSKPAEPIKELPKEIKKTSAEEVGPETMDTEN